MRKLSLLLFAMVLFAFSANAQSYSQDFNNGIPSNMRLIDNDGLTPYYSSVFTEAWIAYERAAGDSMALSTSWYSPAGTSDDWIITPKFVVGTGDYLAWEAMAWSANYADGYVVKLSTTDSAMSSFTTTLMTVAAENNKWTGHTVDLSSYAGDTVWIAFINNSNDKFILSLDNIKVFTTQYAVKPVSVNMPVKIGMNLGPFDVAGTVVNQGLATITSYTLNYSVNGGYPVSSVVTASGSGFSIYGTDDFKAATQWNPTAVGNYTIKVWITDVNGTNTNTLASDTVSATVEIVAQSVQRLPLFETFTSSTCGPCVAGNQNLKSIFDANPNMWTCVKYQMSWPGNGDPYYTAEGGTRRQYYGVSSVPHQYIDGGYDGNSASVKQADLMNAYYTISYLDINAAMTITGKTCDINITMDPKDDITGNLKLFTAIVEKKTTKNVGSNGETEFFWVMKKMVPDANGTALSNFTSGTSVTKTLNWTFKGNYRLPANAKSPIDNATEHSVEEFNDLIAVVWVQDYSKKDVIQSAFSSVTIGMDEVERANLITAVYPNPAQDQVNINLNMEQTENVSVRIFNTLGQVVYNKNYGTMSGANTLNIQLDNLSEGVYFVKIVVGDKMYTKPLQITK
jgi:hypothetical protein